MSTDEVEDAGEPQEPSPEDYIKTPCGRLGSRTCVSQVEGKFLGDFESEMGANHTICAKMKKDKVFSTVWFLSDHGNLEIDSEFECQEFKEET